MWLVPDDTTINSAGNDITLPLQCFISGEKLQWNLKGYIMSWYHITTCRTYSINVCNSMDSIQNAKYLFLFLCSLCSLFTSIFLRNIFWFDHFSIVLNYLTGAEGLKANPVIITFCTYSQGELHLQAYLHLYNPEWLPSQNPVSFVGNLASILSWSYSSFLVSIDFRAWLYFFLLIHSGSLVTEVRLFICKL